VRKRTDAAAGRVPALAEGLGSQFQRVFDAARWWVLLGKGGWWKFEYVVGLESFVKVGFTTIQV
jgi:hypothetical protein